MSCFQAPIYWSNIVTDDIQELNVERHLPRELLQGVEMFLDISANLDWVSLEWSQVHA
jgi:hypothetical protein